VAVELDQLEADPSQLRVMRTAQVMIDCLSGSPAKAKPLSLH
jgi:hypothetical protein